MPFSWNQEEHSRIGSVGKWDIPFSDWAGLKWESGFQSTIGNALTEFTEDRIWSGDDLISASHANKVWGIEGHLKFDKDISNQLARLRHERKQREIELAAQLDAASHSALSVKGAVGFAAEMVGGFSHPLDLGTMFLNTVGSEARAAKIVGTGFAAKAQRVLARGIVTEEAIAAKSPLPFKSLQASIVEGMLSQALVEIPVAYQKTRNQADYDATNFAFNVAGSGIFAGALHVGGKALLRSLRAVSDYHNSLSPEVKQARAAEIAEKLLNDEPAVAHTIDNLDPSVLRAKALERVGAFDEAKARFEAAEMQVGELGIARPVRRDPSLESLSEEEFTALKKKVYKELEVEENPELHSRQVIAAAQDRYSAVELEQFRRDVRNSHPEDLFHKLQKELDLVDRNSISPTDEHTIRVLTILDEMERQKVTLGESVSGTKITSHDQLEILKDNSERLKLIIESEARFKAEVSRDMDEIAKAAIEARIATMKEAHEARVKGEMGKIRAAEIEANRGKTVIATPEQVKAAKIGPVPEKQHIDALEKEVGELEAEAADELRLSQEDEGADVDVDTKKSDLQKELEASLKEPTLRDDSAAIEAAIPCVTKIK